MSSNKISAELTTEQVTTILASVQSVRDTLPFMVNLTKDERIRLAKLSKRFVDFVDRGYRYASANPDFVPNYVDISEFEKDMNLKESLSRILVDVNALSERLRDTILLVDSEAYEAARVFYQTARTAAKVGSEDAERIVKDMGVFYKKKPPVPKEPEKTKSLKSAQSTQIKALSSGEEEQVYEARLVPMTEIMAR